MASLLKYWGGITMDVPLHKYWGTCPPCPLEIDASAWSNLFRGVNIRYVLNNKAYLKLPY